MSINLNMQILVVDDSGTMRMMFKQMLKKAGFTNVVAAVDGKDGIVKLSEHNVELIISDWNMPKMDGLELLQWVRKDDKYCEIPFIMATAQGDKGQQKTVKDNGGNGHIAKPFDEVEIKKKIELVFGDETLQEAPKREISVINGKVQLKIAHIQITDHLALGVLKHQIESGEVTPQYFDLETIRIPGWNPIQESLEKGDIDGAFVLAPIAMDLFAYDTPIKLVSLAHKNGSTFVRSKRYNSLDYDSIKNFYKYKVVDIPHKMSVHNMLSHMYLSEMGLKPGVPGKKAINVRFEVVPPIKMPLIMKENDNVAGFMVAEPIATNAIAKGIADLEFLSTTLWDNHPCCVVTMQDEMIQKHEDAVNEFVTLLTKAGIFIEKNRDKAAEIAVKFLDPEKKIGLTTGILSNVLNQPKGIKMNDLYPVLDDLDRMQQYMHLEMGIGKLIDLEQFVDLRFADEAKKSIG